MSWLSDMSKILAGRKDTLRAKNRLHASLDYLDAYAANSDLRIAEDPKRAIGGNWEQLGQLQFKFLVDNGLKPSSSLLDIGCGTLRAGRHFIRYLDAGCYTGFDMSREAIKHAHSLVADEGLTAKIPILFVNEEKNIRFEQLNHRTFDYILAQSVFTHLPEENVIECLAHVSSIMHENSAFFFTIAERDSVVRLGTELFAYSFSFLSNAAKNAGLSLTRRPDYEHPRGQVMLQSKLL